MKPVLKNPISYNPDLHGKQCSCESGKIFLSKYSGKELQRELLYECNRCNKKHSFVCADRHRFFEAGSDF